MPLGEGRFPAITSWLSQMKFPAYSSAEEAAMSNSLPAPAVVVGVDGSTAAEQANDQPGM
ncbi:hypothetical protein BST39_18710 [Mycobacterium paraseoulense]|uniref:Uncharacterized protein n=1 Tax=Mycobacterium paraseoulense TaxID=590652 RepID=A0A1X0I7D7_9MYCO|nr:hypothetical protein BST39_18710 [Mycobacterium paraseoulense]